MKLLKKLLTILLATSGALFTVYQFNLDMKLGSPSSFFAEAQSERFRRKKHKKIHRFCKKYLLL